MKKKDKKGQIKPFGDRVLIRPFTEDEVKGGKRNHYGIIIPDTADKERPERGEVIAVGPGRELENGNRSSMPVTVGQIVLFKKYAPDEIKVDGEEFLVITLSDVMAIVE